MRGSSHVSTPQPMEIAPGLGICVYDLETDENEEGRQLLD